MIHLPTLSLRRRLLVLLALTISALLLLSGVAYFFMVRMLRQNQAAAMARSQAVALQIIKLSFDQLQEVVEHPEAWQRFRKRMRDGGVAPGKPGLLSLPWPEPALDLFLLFNKSGQLIFRFERDDNHPSREHRDFPYQVYLSALGNEKFLQGFADSPQGVYLVAASNFSKIVQPGGLGPTSLRGQGRGLRPASKGKQGGGAGTGTGAVPATAASGFALAARRLDERLATTIKTLANVDVVFYWRGKPIISTLTTSMPSIPDSFALNRTERPAPLFSWPQNTDADEPPATLSLNDFIGRPVAHMRLLNSHELTSRSRSALTVRLLWFVGGSLLIFGIAAIATESWIVSPLRKLQSQVRNLQGNNREGKRLHIKRRDEIGELAAAINTLMLQGETAHRQSLQAHALIDQIVQSAGIGIVALNHRGHLLILNQKLEEMLGCKSDEVEMRGWFETIYNNPEERQAAVEKWRKQLNSNVAFNEEWQLTTAGSGKRILAVITTPLQKPEGKAVGTISFCHDITKQKQLENQLEHTRRLASLGTLAGGIAHNFNNILCGILGYTTLGRERVSADDPVREYFAIIEQSATRASQLTQQLLMFSKGRQGTFQLVDLRPLIHEVVGLLRETLPKSITIEETYNNDWLFLRADGGQIYQSLMNICLNARDAMPDGGRLTIESKLENYDPASLPSPELTSGRYVRLEISDTGTGMSNDIKQRLFEPFFTTKAPGKGTGLGLATVYGTIKSHHGHIQVLSEMGRGTTFIIYLPALKDLFGEQETNAMSDLLAPHQMTASRLPVRQAGDRGQMGKPSPERPYGKGNILIVEDEEMIRRSSKIILEDQGYAVYLANDGAEALEYIQHSETPWSAIILDLILPHVSGEEVLSFVQQTMPHVPVIIASGCVEQTPHHFEAMKADSAPAPPPYECMDAGRSPLPKANREAERGRGQQILQKAKAVLHKPYTGQQLLDTLQELLKNSVSRVAQEQ